MKDKIYDAIIIGGGASGLCCANFLNTKNYLIVDKSPLGKKLLVTGNGRCNFTNINLDLHKYNRPEAAKIIKNFDQHQTINFFKSLGIESYYDEEGRVYPLSESSSDVSAALTRAVKQNYRSGEVLEIKKEDVFYVKLKDEVIKAKNVVVACGGESGHQLLQKFNKNLQQTLQVLTGFLVKNYNKKLFGLREDALVKAHIDGKEFCEKGQVQFKKDGVSGIVILNLSAFTSKNSFDFSLHLLPKIPAEKLKNILVGRKKLNLEVKDLLFGIFKKPLAEEILNRAKILNLNDKIKSLSDSQIDKVVFVIKNFKLSAEGRYSDGQVVFSGQNFLQLNNLQLTKGLYLTGEAAGIYGASGGYNLQWAFSSGKFAADKINMESFLNDSHKKIKCLNKVKK